MMRPEDAEEYTQALGQVVAGSWRQVALGKRLGVPEALGISTAAWVEDRLGGYVRLSITERREAVKELTAPPEEGGSGMSMREAADILGVGKSTVSDDVKTVQNRTDVSRLHEQSGLTIVQNRTPDAAKCDTEPPPEVEQAVSFLTPATDETPPPPPDPPVHIPSEIINEVARAGAATRRAGQRASDVAESDRLAYSIAQADVTERIPLEARSVDLIVTSPPYGLDKPYRDTTDPSVGWGEFMADWLAEAYRVARDGGRLALNIPLDTTRGGFRPTYAEAVQAAEGAGWTYRATIVWDEGNTTKGNRGLGSLNSPSAPHPVAPVEMIPLFSKGDWKREATSPADIEHAEWQEFGNGLWKFSGESRAWEGHPAPFPEELPRRLIRYLSFVGDTVLDPFCGSGTTVLVAQQLKRRAVGFDISGDYVASARRRIAALGEAIS